MFNEAIMSGGSGGELTGNSEIVAATPTLNTWKTLKICASKPKVVIGTLKYANGTAGADPEMCFVYDVENDIKYRNYQFGAFYKVTPTIDSQVNFRVSGNTVEFNSGNQNYAYPMNFIILL